MERAKRRNGKEKEDIKRERRRGERRNQAKARETSNPREALCPKTSRRRVESKRKQILLGGLQLPHRHLQPDRHRTLGRLFAGRALIRLPTQPATRKLTIFLIVFNALFIYFITWVWGKEGIVLVFHLMFMESALTTSVYVDIYVFFFFLFFINLLFKESSSNRNQNDMRATRFRS